MEILKCIECLSILDEKQEDEGILFTCHKCGYTFYARLRDIKEYERLFYEKVKTGEDR